MRRWLAMMSIAAACGYPQLPRLTGDASGSADAPSNALVVTSVPATFDLHVLDSRQTLITIMTPTPQATGPVTLAATGLVLAGISIPSVTDQCSAGIAAGASCTVVGVIDGQLAGNDDFQINANAAMGQSGSSAITL